MLWFLALPNCNHTSTSIHHYFSFLQKEQPRINKNTCQRQNLDSAVTISKSSTSNLGHISWRTASVLQATINFIMTKLSIPTIDTNVLIKNMETTPIHGHSVIRLDSYNNLSILGNKALILCFFIPVVGRNSTSLHFIIDTAYTFRLPNLSATRYAEWNLTPNWLIIELYLAHYLIPMLGLL